MVPCELACVAIVNAGELDDKAIDGLIVAHTPPTMADCNAIVTYSHSNSLFLAAGCSAACITISLVVCMSAH